MSRKNGSIAKSNWTEDGPSVAVLPLRNIGNDPSNFALVDGISDDLARSLSKFRNLIVIASQSSFQFRGSDLSVSNIGKLLGAEYIVQGSLRRQQRRLRLVVELADANTESCLWSERYDGDVESVFAIQEEITAKAVYALSIQMDIAERARMRRQPPTVFRAYELVLQGRQFVSYCEPERNAIARRLYEAALDVDPCYARAYAAISRSHNLDWRYSWSDVPDRSLEQALKLARQAIVLDPHDARGHAELGFVQLYLREHDASIAAYERAIQLNPNDADILAEMADALKHSGRPEDALEIFGRAMRLNPFYPDEYLWDLAGVHFKLGDYEETIRTVYKMKNMTEGRRLLAASYAYLGRLEEARREAALIRQTHPNMSADYWRQRLPDREPEKAEHFIEGLRIAGL